ncbi:MAG: Rieske 2Fe-2S domain-containing protein [Proteobacteria bacterium]|nr:Rieske 2Fe-2S domain-containing protein [Pseudomonadota bacterium]
MPDETPPAVGSYQRRLPVSLARVWENVLDWEHLPWLHSQAFLDIALIEASAAGWRARVGLPPAERRSEIELELVVEREAGRYVARTLSGPGAGTEIWTSLDPTEEHETGVHVSFHVPGVPAAQAERVGAGFATLYRGLWDQDEAMMCRRSEWLARPRPGPESAKPLSLGTEASLRARLPVVVEWGGRPFRIVDDGGVLRVHAAWCPHALGPLEAAPLVDGAVRCPWHGYAFDIDTRKCREHPALRLASAPQLDVDAQTGNATLRAPEAERA